MGKRTRGRMGEQPRLKPAYVFTCPPHGGWSEADLGDELPALAAILVAVVKLPGLTVERLAQIRETILEHKWQCRLFWLLRAIEVVLSGDERGVEILTMIDRGIVQMVVTDIRKNLAAADTDV